MKFIALDWDNTFTADPPLWLGFIKEAQKRHRVFIVTARPPEHGEEIRQAMDPLGVEIIFCSGQPKIAVTDEAQVSIDIWIDDMPELLFSEARH